MKTPRLTATQLTRAVALWEKGFDTNDISKPLMVREAAVYNSLVAHLEAETMAAQRNLRRINDELQYMEAV